MTQINPKINIYQAKPSFKADGIAMPFMPGMNNSDFNETTIPSRTEGENSAPVVELPDIYYSPNTGKKKTIKDAVKKADVMDLIYPWFEHPLLMLATCFGISKGVDAFSKSCNKEYEKSILGKAAKFGDKIENSKIVQSNPVQTGLKWTKTGWDKIKNFAMKNSIIRSMVETPSMPENPMPRNELLSHQERMMEKFGEVLRDTGLLPANEGKYKGTRKVDYHFDKDAIKDLKEYFSVDKISKISDEKAVSRYLLKRAGVAETEIKSIIDGGNCLNVTREKLLEMAGGRENLQKLISDKSVENVEKNIDEMVKICDKFKGIKTRKGTKIPFLTKQPLTNESGFQDVYNRIYSMGKGAATKTGRFMSKFLQMVHRGFTFGGSKTGVLIWVAPHIMHTLVNTYKADKSEKVGTFVNGMISAISWVFVFPLVLRGIHAYGGIQYAGMGKEKVEEMKKLIEDFNADVKAGKFKDFKAWKKARNDLKKQIKDMRRVENQGFVTKVLRKISEFTKSDLLKPERYKDSSFIKNIFRNGPANLKNFIWSAGRFMVFMMIGMPLVDKVINKCISAVFGRNYDDTIEKENQEAKEKQKEFLKEDLQERMYEAQAAKMGITAQESGERQKDAVAQSIEEKPVEEQIVAQEQNNVQPEPESEQTEAAVPEAEAAIKRDNYTYIPSQENVIKTSLAKPENKYIPSQLPGKFVKNFDNSGVDAVMRRADRAEAMALRVLSGQFPS